jgi:hypothetical protein
MNLASLSLNRKDARTQGFAKSARVPLRPRVFAVKRETCRRETRRSEEKQTGLSIFKIYTYLCENFHSGHQGKNYQYSIQAVL